jgi:hypothetical protein
MGYTLQNLQNSSEKITAAKNQNKGKLNQGGVFS